MYRHALYLGGYLAVIAGICANNYLTGKSFYHSLIGLVENRVQHFILCSFFVFLVYLATQLTVRVFIGKLTPLELEGVQESGIRYLGNICLIITLFADDVSLKGLIIFAVVLGLKVLHWSIGLRIDTVEKNGGFADNAMVRMYAMCGLLLALDLVLLVKAVRHALLQPGVSILFAFEFSQVAAYAVRCIYAITVLHLVRERSIEDRILMMFYGDFVFGVFKIAAHLGCLVWTTIHFRMPINLLRESMYIIKHLTTKTRSVLMYQSLLKELAGRPDISGDQLGDSKICLICHEDMEKAKQLECSHMFHLDCLKEWLHRQQVCPVCRKEFMPSAAATPPRQPASGRPEERANEPSARVYFREGQAEYEGFPVTLEDE